MFKQMLISAYKTIGRWYLSPMLKREARIAPANPRNERPIEYAFAFNCIARLSPMDVLDVGSGVGAFPHVLSHCGLRVTAIDKIEGYWTNTFFNRHFQVVNDDITHTALTEQVDLITCISVLEHIPDHNAAVSGMFKLLKPGGHLVLTIPYNENTYLENVYKRPEAGYGKELPFICQVFSRRELDGWLKQNNAALIEQEFHEVFSGEFWTFSSRLYPPRKTTREGRHQLTCLLLKKN